VEVSMSKEKDTPKIIKNKKKIYQHENNTSEIGTDNKIISLLDEETEVNSDGNKNSLIHMGCSNSC